MIYRVFLIFCFFCAAYWLLAEVVTAKLEIVRMVGNRPELRASGVPVGSTNELVGVVNFGDPVTVFTTFVKGVGTTNFSFSDNGATNTRGFYWLRQHR